MAAPRHVAVVDIGKTNAKLALVALEGLAEVAVRKAPNRPLSGGPYPHHDAGAIRDFILDGLAELGRAERIDAVSVTTHGATAALLDAGGGLALPVLDYEHDGPDTMRAEYESVRPPFAETGTPPLPLGLNLGAQLFWQGRAFPEAFAGVASILTWPQYWAFRLSGVAASEATSLGCHTDLWAPHAGTWSSLTRRMGWDRLFPPLRPADARLGPLLPEIARRTGLDPATPVLCGIHDSNASLLPHLRRRAPPFAVVSTGTWVVAMAVGGRRVTLDPARDTLVNVSATGDPVPSARFMGGREYETITAGRSGWSEADVEAVLSRGILLLPAVEPGSGPFPGLAARWAGGEEPASGMRMVAASFYLALMTAACLELIGAEGEIVVEGPFAANPLYVEMLGAATARPVLPSAGQATGTSIGAALLAAPSARVPETSGAAPGAAAPALAAYAEAWRRAAAGHWRQAQA